MGKINVDYDVLNQKGSPAWYSDLFANIPTPGYTGRMFISTDTFAFYRDNGTGWDLTGGPGIGTITGSGVIGQVSFFSGTQVLSGSTNLIWDNTNNRLGIGVASPTVTLEISGSVKATALVKIGGTSAQILLADGTTTPTSTFQAAITLTTTGTTGASTLVGATLNVPTYTFVSSVSPLTLGTSGTDLTSSVANSTTTPVITLNVPTASATNRGALSSADWTTFNNKQATITLTTTGTSGAATLVGATLNIPNYTNVGTVTSVAALTLGTTGTDLSSSVANSTSTPVITLNVPTASATNRGALSSADWTTFNNKQATISVTAPVVLTGATISMPAATTSVSGYLTSTDWNTFNNKTSNLGTVTDVVALTIGTSGIDITSTAVTTTTTPVITLNIPTASASNRGALSSTDWTTFNNKQATLSLTTTGTSGAATLVANTLNVPNYGSALSGYLPLTGGTLTGPLTLTNANINLSNAFSLTARNNANSSYISLIQRNTSDKVSIDADGYGTVLGGTLSGTSATFTGSVGVGISPSVKFQVNNGTNINLGIKVGQTDVTAVMLNAFNDALTANIPLEFRALSYSFTLGAATFSSHLISNSPGGGVNAASFYDRTGSIGAAVDQYGTLAAYTGILNNNGDYGSGASGTPLVFKSGAVEQFRVSATNMVVAGTLGINGTSNNIKSGTYTPTLTNYYNISASSFDAFTSTKYVRIGNNVTVTGSVIITPTTPASYVILYLSLPIASTNTDQGTLTGSTETNEVVFGGVLYTSSVCILQFNNVTNSSRYVYYTFTYIIS